MGGGVKIPCTMEAPGRGEAPKAWFFRQIGGLYMIVFQRGGEGSFFGRQRGGLKASLYPVSMYGSNLAAALSTLCFLGDLN